MRTGLPYLIAISTIWRELRIALVLEADIAGIDAVFVERLGAGRVIGQQLVADVVEIADDRHVDAHLAEPVLDVRHGGRRLVAVDGDAHQLGAGARQRRHLAGGALHVGGVGIGHRLHDDRGAAADHDAADIHPDRFMTLLLRYAHRTMSPETKLQPPAKVPYLGSARQI